jgi:acetyl esterase
VAQLQRRCDIEEMIRLRSVEDIPDEKVREILAQMDPRGNCAVMSIEQKRALQLKGIVRAGEPAPVAAIEDHSMLTRAGEKLRVRLYRPEQSRGNLPVVLYVHGGGFFAGSLETHEPVCRAIANLTPAQVVSVDYRLAPEHRWPAALDDCFDALLWITQTLRPRRLIIAGDSAGGNLAACAALQADGSDVRIDAQVLIYPMLDAVMSLPAYVENALVPPFTLLDCVYVWQLFLPRDADRRTAHISPLYAKPDALQRQPAALILTAEYDILRDDGLSYGNALREAGVRVEHEHYAAMPHGFLLWGATVRAAIDGLERIAAFVRSV